MLRLGIRTVQRRAPYSTAAAVASPGLIELKVGLIKDCQRHPDADKLYVSQIIASKEDEPEKLLTVCSGLVDYIPRDELLNKKVILITNLKPSKMRGIKSEAMLLAADNTFEDNTKVEIVQPPHSANIGEELHFEGHELNGTRTRLKSKIWEALQPQLSTDNKGSVIFKEENGNIAKLIGPNSSEPAFVNKLFNSSVR